MQKYFERPEFGKLFLKTAQHIGTDYTWMKGTTRAAGEWQKCPNTMELPAKSAYSL